MDRLETLLHRPDDDDSDDAADDDGVDGDDDDAADGDDDADDGEPFLECESPRPAAGSGWALSPHRV